MNPTVRNLRAKQFNAPKGEAAFLGDITDPNRSGTGSGQFFDQAMPNPMPTASSDYIASGELTGFQPFLSEDHTKIYSELSFHPQEVIKGSNLVSEPGEAITILQSGGSLKLTGGRTVFSPPAGGTYPLRVDRKYLLFLRYQANTKAFTVVTAWDLSGPSPTELDGDGHPYHDPDASVADQTNTIVSLLDLVRSKVSQ